MTLSEYLKRCSTPLKGSQLPLFDPTRHTTNRTRKPVCSEWKGFAPARRMEGGMTATIASAQPKTTPATAALRSVSLCGPVGRLEALLNEGAPNARFAALVCHPHPLRGGSMHNKVVYHAMKVLNDPQWGLGWPVLRFNFRGT